MAASPQLPPYDLADALRRRHGIDVSDVAISRGPESADQAGALGARAFTSGGNVVLPPGAGPLDQPQTRALLAHELTHAAQQRALGPSLPPEDSPAGVALEEQALATERLVLGPSHGPADGAMGGAMGGQPPGPREAAVGQRPGQTLFPVPSVHTPPPAAGASWSLPGLSVASLQRQAEDITGLTPAGNAFDPFALLPQQASAPTPPGAVDGVIAAAGRDADGADTELGAARARLLELAEQRLLDLDDPVALGELADGIYPRLHARLRRELLVDRERSGLLSDFR